MPYPGPYRLVSHLDRDAGQRWAPRVLVRCASGNQRQGSPRREPSPRGADLARGQQWLRPPLYEVELHFVGVDKWRAANGIIFVVGALREPEPPFSKVVEIKLGTCGDF